MGAYCEDCKHFLCGTCVVTGKEALLLDDSCEDFDWKDEDATSTEGKTEAVAEQPRYNIGTLVVRKETKPGQALNRKTADVKSEAAPDTKISDGMKEDEWWCEICGNKIDHPPQYCCNGFDCGCRNMPTEPPVCSEECYNKFMRKVQRKESK